MSEPKQVTIVFIQQQNEEKRSGQQSMLKELSSCLGGGARPLVHADCSAFARVRGQLGPARTMAAMSRPPATSRKVRRVLVLLALFLLLLPEPKTGALNSARGVPEQPQASNADGAGFAWSGGRAVSEVGCDVRHGVPKIRKPQRGRFLQEYGHTTCSSHAGLRREAETERKFCVKLMSIMS